MSVLGRDTSARAVEWPIRASTIHDQTLGMIQDVKGGALTRSGFDAYLGKMEHGMNILLRTLTRAADLISGFKQVVVDQSGNIRRSMRLNEVLREVGLMLAPVYKHTPYKLVMELGEDVAMDSYPGSITQVIANFVSNAVMHGFEGCDHGTMRLQTQAIGEEGGADHLHRRWPGGGDRGSAQAGVRPLLYPPSWARVAPAWACTSSTTS